MWGCSDAGLMADETYLGAKRGRMFCPRKVRQWKREKVANGSTLTVTSAIKPLRPPPQTATFPCRRDPVRTVDQQNTVCLEPSAALSHSVHHPDI